MVDEQRRQHDPAEQREQPGQTEGAARSRGGHAAPIGRNGLRPERKSADRGGCGVPPFRVAPSPERLTPTLDRAEHGRRASWSSRPLADRVERRESGRLYGRTATELTGAVELGGPQVRYRDALTRRQRWGVMSLGWFHVVLTLALTGYLLAPANLPWLGSDPVIDVLTAAGLLIMVVLQLVSALRTWTITYHAGRARDPIPMTAATRPAGGRAHHDRAQQGADRRGMATLRGMQRIVYCGPVDVWILDEGDDPEVRRRRAARRPALQPQGPTRVQPAER